MRVLLVILLLHGLIPGAGEILETVVHRITTGHFAHSEGEPHDRGSDTGEHGCTPTAHRCHCCPNQPAIERTRSLIDVPSVLAGESFPDPSTRAKDGVITGVFRPPIV